jgi:hypothetical protein
MGPCVLPEAAGPWSRSDKGAAATLAYGGSSRRETYSNAFDHSHRRQVRFGCLDPAPVPGEFHADHVLRGRIADPRAGGRDREIAHALAELREVCPHVSQQVLVRLDADLDVG